MSNQYYFFGSRTTFIYAAPKIFCRVNGPLDFAADDQGVLRKLRPSKTKTWDLTDLRPVLLFDITKTKTS